MTYHHSMMGLGATPGSGVSPESATEAQTARAMALYGEGLAAYGAGNHAAALRKFTNAYNTVTHPLVLRSIGMSMMRLGRLGEARARFERFVRETPDHEQVAAARADIERIDAVLPRTTPPGTSEPIEKQVEAVGAPLVPAAPPPTAADVYDPDVIPTLIVWAATGLGIAALVGVGVYLTRRKRPTPNRRRRSSRRR